MPVISPRSSIYGTTGSTGGSSSVGSSGYGSGLSYLDRGSSLSKGYSSSSYSPSFNYSSSYSSYSPRTSAYRSSSSSSSYLSGGSSALGTYRSTSYLGAGSNDTISSSRYGLSKKPTSSTDTLKKDGRSYESKKPPSGSDRSSDQAYKRQSCQSSSSLARLVATSGLDIYEKYSPAHYKPNCELTRSRSEVDEAAVASAGEGEDARKKDVTSATLEKPRSRYSRLYNNNNDADAVDHKTSFNRSSLTTNSRSKSSSLKPSSSTGDVPTATYTLRSNRRVRIVTDDDNTTTLRNGHSEQNINNCVEQLKDLKLSSSASNLELENVNGSNHKDYNNNANDISANDCEGSVSTTATFTLDMPKGNKVNSSKGITTAKALARSVESAAAASTATRTKTANKRSLPVPAHDPSSNPVRAANQKFFLISSFKDQNFLKEECELAHAQVAAPPQGGSRGCGVVAQREVSVAGARCVDSQNNNNTTGNSNLRHNLSQLPRSSAPLVNGMRRISNGETTQSNVVVHRVEIGFNPSKTLPKLQKSSPVVTSNSAASGGAKLGVRQVKPLVHRTIPATAVAAVNAVTASKADTAISHSNKVNNNHNSLFNNNTRNGLGTSGNMQRTSLEQDDIKFIDSDEAPTVTQEPKKSAHCEHSCCKPQPLAAAKPRTRPKSTIVCSATNPHQSFEKVNNYKYANGGTNTAAGDGLATRRAELRQSGIDSSSIKASIEKFNSLSEQKRLPLSSVAMRQHSGSGSTSNLQHHRHSSDFDNCNMRLANSNSSSLTRASYYTPFGKVITTLHPTASAATAASTRAVFASSGSANTNSLPTKGSSGVRSAAGAVTLSRTAERASASSLLTKEAASSDGSGDAIDDSARSATVRTLPPPTPTTATSRYWDRENSRATSGLSSASTDADALKSSASDEKTEGLCGLRNIGNTCFMNSVIQCLSHTSELTKFLRNYNGCGRSSPTKDQQILHEFAKLISEMWTTRVRSVTPMELKRAFSLKHRMYSDYSQQDAQEFLRFFLDSLHTALNNGTKGEHLKIDDNLSDNKKADLTWEWYTRIENSLIRDLFVGQLKSTLACTTCGNTSVTFDPFWDLSVSLPSLTRCKLDACLDMFIREEVLDGDEMPTCSKCKTRRRCTKSLTIQRFPKYLVIHLKRFSETRWSKLSNIVEFPTGERELNMGPYGSNANSNMYYSLYAISNHMGSTAGGHYVALCKHPVSRKWHEFNDNIVSEALSDSHLVSSSAYILFYERA